MAPFATTNTNIQPRSSTGLHADNARKNFHKPGGDHMTMLHVYKQHLGSTQIFRREPEVFFLNIFPWKHKLLDPSCFDNGNSFAVLTWYVIRIKIPLQHNGPSPKKHSPTLHWCVTRDIRGAVVKTMVGWSSAPLWATLLFSDGNWNCHLQLMDDYLWDVSASCKGR